MGEVAIALKLAAKLKELDPEFFCVLTTTTTTGFHVATSEAGEGMEVLYSPLDFWPIMRRSFAVIRPVRVVLVEAEVWPNLAAEARDRRIPLALVNARLSKRSEARFRRFRLLIEPTFRCLDAVCVQELEDVERWVALGVPRRADSSRRQHQVRPGGRAAKSRSAAGSFAELWDRRRQSDSLRRQHASRRRGNPRRNLSTTSGRLPGLHPDHRAAACGACRRNSDAARATRPERLPAQ